MIRIAGLPGNETETRKRTLVYILAGIVLGATAALAIAMAVVTLGHVPSESGGREMEVIFVWMPAGAILGVIAALILRFRR